MEIINNKLRLSIVVPAYNVEPYIERCLLSLLNQDIPKSEYEIIVVDDGSSDYSAHIAQRVADENENIIVVHRENGGMGAARNTGMEHVRGQYVFFVDSDDYIESNVLSAILQSAEKRNLDLLMFRAYHRGYNNKVWENTYQPFFETDTIYDGENLILQNIKLSSVWQHIYNVDVLNKYGFRFMEGIIIGEDIEFNYRLFTKLLRVGFVNVFVYNYCSNAGHSITRKRDLKQRARFLLSDLRVAASVKSYIRSDFSPEKVFRKLDSRMNSMLISQLYSLLFGEGRNQSMAFVQKYMVLAKSLNAYPIRGYCEKSRTKIARLFMNCKPLLLFLFRLTRSFKQKESIK